MPWLKVSATEIANRRLRLAELWGRRARQPAEQLFETTTSDGAATILEQSLSARLPPGERFDGTNQNVGRALAGRPRCSCGPRRQRTHASRRCNELFGYGPKTFARILRFQQFIACVRRANRFRDARHGVNGR